MKIKKQITITASDETISHINRLLGIVVCRASEDKAYRKGLGLSPQDITKLVDVRVQITEQIFEINQL